MVVIIAAGPTTPRNGRSRNRSIPTPMAPQTIMDVAKPAASTPNSGRPDSTVSWPTSPNDCSVSMAIMEPTMNTLKWAKLISSAMPYTSVKPRASSEYMAPRLRPLMTC